jgi:hypothetical protein
MAQDRVCLRIRGNDGKPISEATLKRRFARELQLAKVEVETIVLTQFMAAIKRGERWAIYKYMDQQMWRPESGGWRARPYEVATGGAHPVASGGSDFTSGFVRAGVLLASLAYTSTCPPKLT